MVDLTMDKVHSLMRNQTNIRNISVIAHVDHGKSTLTDTLVIKARIASVDSGGGRYMDTRADEQERGITIKSTAISMHFTMPDHLLKNSHLNPSNNITAPNSNSSIDDNTKNLANIDQTPKLGYNGNEFLINLIDSPGHVDFSSEVTAALRVTDGALVVVDCVDGICVQTETVLRQAVAERIKPTLVLNKLDRALLELQDTPTELYVKLRKRVEDFNAKLQTICCAYEDNSFKLNSLDPALNEVSFCSGLQQWGFSIRTFAKFYITDEKRQKTPDIEQRLCKILWSNNSYFSSDDPFDKTGKFSNKPDSGSPSFVVFILNPIYKVMEMCKKEIGDKKGLIEYLKKFNVDLSKEDLPIGGKPLFKTVMRLWLPASDTLFEQIVLQLPSPVQSQKYRASLLYEGPEDKAHLAIKNSDCSSDAPLMLYISKMVPYGDNRFIAFGRVFSGSVCAGQKVRIQGQDYVPGSKQDLFIKSIQRVVVMMGKTIKDIPDCPAGNIVGIIGIDNELKKTGTITNWEGSYNIRSMRFSVSPVVKYSVKPKNASDLPKLKEGLIKLSKSDPLCVVNFNDNGECTVAGAGELHLEIALNDLRDFTQINIIVGEPLVSYLEGISGQTSNQKMSKSANKHNRIYMTCEELEEEVISGIESGKLVARDPKERSALFRDQLGINDEWVKKILFYGPEDKGPNIVVDETKGIAYLNEIKEFMREGFREVTTRGPLLGENLKGVRFNLTDLTLHSDAIHRTGNQITAPMTAVCKGLIMNSDPILYEPLFLIEINVSNQHMNGASNCISKRRGVIESFEDLGGVRSVLKGYIPVRESFGLNKEIMSETKGEASTVVSFSHYTKLPGKFDDPTSLTNKTITALRTKRGLGELKLAESYFDRL